MTLLSGLLSRGLGVADIGFDAVNTFWRVVLRGAFAPDAKSYRSARFSPIAGSDLFMQEIALNAAEPDEAKKAVLLDAERLLPLAPDLVAFDVAGPLAEDDRPRTRPERTFLLAVVRKEALQRARESLPALKRGGVEAFVHAPTSHPGFALVFNDDTGVRRRRTRRALLAVALLVFDVSAIDALRSYESFLERKVEAANSERLAVDRRVRMAERDKARAEAEGAALAQSAAPQLADVTDHLSRVARHQPPDSELQAVSLEGRTLSLRGRAYAPDTAELALRRAFEAEEMTFAAEEGEVPRSFEARLALPARERHP
jgi:hypothetical protein